LGQVSPPPYALNSGAAERALELMCRRSVEREAFGKRLAQLGGNVDLIAESRIVPGLPADAECRLHDGYSSNKIAKKLSLRSRSLAGPMWHCA
jgi:hypothetical protein